VERRTKLIFFNLDKMSLKEQVHSEGGLAFFMSSTLREQRLCLALKIRCWIWEA
jgi:hypothetical protein